MINQSILQVLFHEEMKIAKVIPIYKCEDEQLVTNYRRISILPFSSKVFEKIISNYIIKFMEENKLFGCNQFGLKKKTFYQPCNHHSSRKGIKGIKHWENRCGCIFGL